MDHIGPRVNRWLDFFGPRWHIKRMQLSQWLDQNGKSAEWLADKIGVTERSVRRYMIGTRFPSPAIIRKIDKITNGDVTANDLLKPTPKRKPGRPRLAALAV